MKSLRTFGGVLALLSGLISVMAQAQDIRAGDLTIMHPKARPNLPNRPTAAYMVIANEGETSDRLLSATSAQFGTVEIHTTMKHGDVMKMMPVENIEIPAGDAAVLEPGGFHLMLFDGAERLQIGDEFVLELNFEQAGSVPVNVKVEKIRAGHGHGSGGYGSHSNSD